MEKQKDVFLYKGSKVDNDYANYLIDVVYKEKKLLLINEEIKLKKTRIDAIIDLFSCNDF